MNDDLINRKALFNALFVYNGKMCPDNDIDNFPIIINAKDVKEAIRNAPTAYDVDKVVAQLKSQESELTTWAEDEAYKLGIEKAIEIVKYGGIE